MQVWLMTLVLWLGLGVAATPLWAADWFVAASGCSEGNDGRDINFPRCSINTTLQRIAGGDTVHIRGGTYSENVTIDKQTRVSGLSNAQPTTIRGYQDEYPVLTGGCTLYAQEDIDYRYWALKKIKFTGNGVQWHGYRLFDFLLEDLEFSGVTGHALSGYYFTRGTYRRIHVHHSGTEWKEHGIYAVGEETIIEDSTFNNNSGYGIQLYSNTCGPGPRPPGASGGPCGHNSIIRNNKVYENGTDPNGCGCGGIVISHASNVQVYNNLVYKNGNNAPGGNGIEVTYAYGQFGDSGPLANTQIYNNVMYGHAHGTGLVISNQAVDTKVYNNIIYNNNETVFDAGQNTTYGPNLVTDPHFEDAPAGNFKLLADSPARNTGSTVLFANTDFAGSPRPQPPGGLPDIGAYEYAEGGQQPPCPAACPTNCLLTPAPPHCPPSQTDTANPIYLSVGGHGDTPTNTGDCSVPENILTPRATLAAALACMTVPGKVLYIRGGTYPGVIGTSGSAITGGNAADTPTRIEGYQSEAVTIQQPVGEYVGLFVNGVNNLTIAKLTVDAMARADSNAFACVGSTNIKILNSTFRNAYYQAGYIANCSTLEIARTTFDGSAVAAVLGLEGTIATTTFDQLTVTNGPLQGIDANASNGGNSSLSILRSQIHHTGATGLDLGAGTGATLVNNIIDHNSAGVRIRSGASGTKLYHNAIASNTPGAAIQCDAGASNVTISNNISFGNGTDSVVNNCAAMLASNMATNPLWVDIAARDFHLQTYPTLSPALDQLSTVLPEAAIAIDGTPRPVNFLTDLGPYEQGAAPPQGGPMSRLQVSATNPRYFADQAGTIVYVTGAYDWNLASSMPDAEAAAYLDFVVAHGYNFLRMPSEDYNGTAQSTTYFTKLASRIAMARSRGIYLEVPIFPHVHIAPFNNQAFDEAYTRSLVQAVGSYENIVFEIGNELETVQLEGSAIGAFPNRIVDVIRDEHTIRGFPQHPICVSDFRAETGDFDDDPAQLSFLLTTSHAECAQIGWSYQFNTLEAQPDWGGQKVSIPETDHIWPYQMDHHWSWKMFTFGHNPSLLDGNAFFPDHSEADNPLDITGGQLTYEARVRMGQTLTYARKLNLATAVPHPELTSTGYALAEPGKQYLVYQPTTGSFTVNVAAGEYTVEWLDPTAQATLIRPNLQVASSGTQSFSTPLSSSNDAVLLLKESMSQPQLPMTALLLVERYLGMWY